MQLCFKEWYYLTEGINYDGLTKMWKRFFPDEQDAVIRQHIDMIAQSDPTPNKEYTNWLVREVLNKRVRLPEDAGILQPDIIFFHDLKRRNQLRRLGVESNIDKFTRHQFQDVVQELRDKQSGQSKRQQEEEIKAKGAEKLYKDKKWMVIKATSEEACIAYGKGSRWCTSGTHGNMANHYLSTGPIIIIHKEGKPFAQMHTHTNQLMDPRDEPIKPKDLPDDLKEILFQVVPKESDKDHIFFYKMTGKISDETRKRAEETTKTLTSKGMRMVKTTSDAAALLLYHEDDQDDMIEEIKNVTDLKPVYGLFTRNGQNYYWQFNLDPNDTNWMGSVYKPYRNGHVRFEIGSHDRRNENHLPADVGKIANKFAQPESIKEAICFFQLTKLTNPRSDQIMLNFLRNLNKDDLKKHKYEYQSSGGMSRTIMYNVYEYFAYRRSDHDELYDTLKTKIDELLGQHEIEKNEIEKKYVSDLNDLESENLPERQKARAIKFLRKEKTKALQGQYEVGINTLAEIIGRAAARKPSPKVMESMIDYARKGWYWPIWNFWTDSLLLAKKTGDEDDDKYYDREEDRYKSEYNTPPWGSHGWQAGEPYIAQWAYRSGHGNYWNEKLRLYANLTDDPKGTMQRMRSLFDQAKQEYEAQKNKDKQEEEEYWNAS